MEELSNEKQENNLEIAKILVLSTAHIKPTTRNWLDSNKVPFTVWACEYGWIMSIDIEWLASAIDNVPEELVACMTFAEGKGATYLRLDGDGRTTDELLQFEWE